MNASLAQGIAPSIDLINVHPCESQQLTLCVPTGDPSTADVSTDDQELIKRVPDLSLTV